MPPRTDRTPRYREHPTTRADFARRVGRTRSTITEACQGPLAPACRYGLIDAAHPVCVAWARARGIAPEQLLEPITRMLRREDRAIAARARHPTPTTTVEALAELASMAADDVRAAVLDAAIPAHHVDADTVAFFLGCSGGDVLDAIDSGSLAAAVQRTGFIDLSHSAVVAFASRRPFAHLPGGEFDAPDDYLSPAMLGPKEIDVSHPVAVIFLARCLGRVPTAAELT